MPKKALLVSHQLDYSGAPVALFEFAKVLISKDWSVDIFSLHGKGALLEDFESIGINLITEPILEIQYQHYELVLFNTVVTTPLIPNIKPKKATWLLWIHESPYLAGFAWSPLVNMKRLTNIDLLIFPSNACKNEWHGLINTCQSIILPSPVDIPKNIIQLSKNHKNIYKTFCVIDPREGYRNINLIEDEIINYDQEAIFNFVGTELPPKDILLKIRSKKNIEVNYLGRVSRQQALETLAKSDIYLSATLMATQNRGLCEAIAMNKKIYISSIKAHVEIGEKANLPIDCFFRPLEKIDFKKGYCDQIYDLNFLKIDVFTNLIEKVLP
jgi:hypothetical protein